MRLLLIGRDRGFGQPFTQHLLREGHVVDWFENTTAVEPLVDSCLYQCVAVDLGQDDAVCEALLDRALRCRNAVATVAVVAPGRDAARRVCLLDQGVDDVLVKPVDLAEAAARLRRVARRRQDDGPADSVLRLGPLALSTGQREVRWFDRPVPLTRKEYGLLEVFMRSRGRVLSRARLEDALYGMDTEIASNAVEVHIHHLRRKLARDVIVSVRSVGYQLGPLLQHA